MVLLTTTPQILDLISSLPPTLQSKLSSSNPPLPTDLTSPISHQTLIALSRANTENVVTLNTLLRGTQPYFPPPPPKPTPSPQYVALMARLRLEQERRDYNALLQRQSLDSTSAEDAEEEEDPISPSLVLNILISIVCCAVAVFYVSRWWASDGIRVLLSLGCGLVVGVAEVTVYAGYLRKVKESRVKERRKKERKVLLGEYEGPGEQEEDKRGVSVAVEEGEKEVIWGKGKYGGMRRRVREKWEKEQESEEIK